MWYESSIRNYSSVPFNDAVYKAFLPDRHPICPWVPVLWVVLVRTITTCPPTVPCRDPYVSSHLHSRKDSKGGGPRESGHRQNVEVEQYDEVMQGTTPETFVVDP